MQLVVVAGPTGVGKTDRAIELARAFDAPVVVLDRVQCHSELAVGSGRCHPDESGRRVFLGERRVADGTISAAAAYRRLCHLLDELRAGGDRMVVLEGGSTSLLTAMASDSAWRHGAEVRTIVLEGGSTSLLTAMARDSAWRHDADVSVEWLAPDTGPYHDRLAHRVERMLMGERSMVDEVRALWPDHRTHSVLRDIVGYREVVAAMRGVAALGQRAMKALVQDVTEAHLAYSQEQCRHLLGVLPLLRHAR